MEVFDTASTLATGYRYIKSARTTQKTQLPLLLRDADHIENTASSIVFARMLERVY
jgi:hypothetical protein